MQFFLTCYSSENPEKMHHGFYKNTVLSSKIVFNIDNKKCLCQISILQWFLKNHVTLKTSHNVPSCTITGINYNLKYVKIENSYLECLLYFLMSFDKHKY